MQHDRDLICSMGFLHSVIDSMYIWLNYLYEMNTSKNVYAPFYQSYQKYVFVSLKTIIYNAILCNASVAES